MKKQLVLKWIIAMSLSLLIANQTQASLILSNLPGEPAVNPSTNLGLSALGDLTKGVGLTMGTDSMYFVSMSVLISNSESPSILSGGIFSDIAGNPDVPLVAFTPLNVTESSSVSFYEYTLTIPDSLILAANTSYWFVLDGPTTENNLAWHPVSSGAAPIALGDITFTGYRYSLNGGTNWNPSSVFNSVAINASPVPVPGASWLFGSCIVGLLGLRKKAVVI